MPETKLKYNVFSRLRYQYEVTLGLYMLTTTEKVILSIHFPKFRLNNVDLIFVSFFTLLVLSSWFYLPGHVSAISKHVRYYLFSDEDIGH